MPSSKGACCYVAICSIYLKAPPFGLKCPCLGMIWVSLAFTELPQPHSCYTVVLGAMQVLPIFEMSRQRPNSHHGALGRGQLEGLADCRHWCNSVTDWWTILLYNMLT